MVTPIIDVLAYGFPDNKKAIVIQGTVIDIEEKRYANDTKTYTNYKISDDTGTIYAKKWSARQDGIMLDDHVSIKGKVNVFKKEEYEFPMISVNIDKMKLAKEVPSAPAPEQPTTTDRVKKFNEAIDKAQSKVKSKPKPKEKPKEIEWDSSKYWATPRQALLLQQLIRDIHGSFLKYFNELEEGN